MAAVIQEWLIDRRVGANLSPWRFAITDDETGGPRDFTADRAGNPDLHTAVFSLFDWDETTAIIDAEDCETLGTDGEVVFTAQLADVQGLAPGKYKVVLLISNESGTAEDPLVFGQRFLGVPTVTP